MYQSLLPFVLAFTLRVGRETKRWPVILILLGLLTYVHPIGTPVWGVAVPLGLWLSSPEKKLLPKLRMLALGEVTFFVVLLPFLFTYFSGTQIGANTTTSYQQVMNIVRERFPVGTFQPEISLFNFFFREGVEGKLGPLWYLFWAAGLAGLLAGMFFPAGDASRFAFRSLAGWVAGILLAAAVIPIVEKKVFAHLQIFPPELELVRNLHYLVPLLWFTLCYALWTFKDPLAAFFLRGRSLPSVWLQAGGFLLLFLWGGVGTVQRKELILTLRQDLTCLKQARLVCPLPPEQTDLIDVLDVLQIKTPPGARIFSEGQEVAIRYYALRPLVFSYKDGGPLAYTSHAQLLDWYEQYVQMTALERMRRFPFRRKGYLKGM